jgi:uncharacterized glyoxalase superfamily protein PhnB
MTPASDLPESPVLEASSLSPSLTVAALSTSVAWYRDVLGCTVTRTFERDGVPFAVSLAAGAVQLLLTQDSGARGTDRLKGEGFSLRWTTSQNIDALAAAIQARGGVLDAAPADGWGARVFRLHDPDGFKFVISSPG